MLTKEQHTTHSPGLFPDCDPSQGPAATSFLGTGARGFSVDPLVFPELAARWLYTSREGQHLPFAVEAAIEAFRIVQRDTVSPVQEPALQKYHQLVEKDLNGPKSFKARRDAEQALVSYIRNTVMPKAMSHEIQRLEKIADQMAACRTTGQHGLGLNGSGNYVENRFLWTSKCRKAKLCPDESRLEGVRIAERYLPHIENWLDAGKNRRSFYLVLTQPNAPLGTLHDAKKQMFKDFVNLLERIRHNKKVRKLVGDIQGALVVQEDPLAARGDWNVHLNVVVLVQGAFNWKELREAWGGFQIHIDEIKRADLAKSFKELCKYQAKATSVGNEHAETKQPGMVDWPAECWLEWWRANNGFRRTRSYGVLYDLPELEEAEEEVADGAESKEVVKTVWLGRMTWNGRKYHVEHFPEALQYVGLIQADKSGFGGRKPPTNDPPNPGVAAGPLQNQDPKPVFSDMDDVNLDAGVPVSGDAVPF